MLDIVEAQDGKDLGVMNSGVSKAANVLSIQLGSLEYAPDFGVDLKYFFQSEFRFQNESFKAYLVQRLVEHQVNVTQVLEVVEALSAKYIFQVGDKNESAKGFIL